MGKGKKSDVGFNAASFVFGEDAEEIVSCDAILNAYVDKGTMKCVRL